MNRKTFITIAIVLILILAGLGVYFFYFKKMPTTSAPGGAAFPGEGMPVTSVPGSGTQGQPAGGEAFVPGSNAPLPRLYELHQLPVAGAGFTETKDKKGNILSIAARYIERGLGHIFETPLATYSESRIVNETRSRLSEALWGNNGKSVVVRSFDDTDNAIKTSILNIGASVVSFAQGTSTTETDTSLPAEEVLLPDFIPFMAVAGDGADKLFYLENGTVASAGSLTNFKNIDTASIFNSSVTEWLPEFPNQKLVTLTTKPSASVPGYLFFLDTRTKALTKVISGLNGLTTLTSRDGTLVLYAEIKDGVPSLSVYNVAKKESQPLSPQTLPEKCVWSTKQTTIVYCAVPQTLPAAQYPDQWYQGLLSFSDDIWKIDTTTGATEKILTPSNLGASGLDMINLAVSSDDTYILFMNKITGTPWIFRIAEESPTSVTSTPAAPPVTTTSVTEGMQKLK